MVNTISISIRRTVALLLSVYLFNFSVDSKDALPDYVEEDLSYNDIESVYEIVAETIFGIDNAVSEYDEHDLEEGESVDIGDFTFYNDYSLLQCSMGTACLIQNLRYNTFCFNQLETCWSKIYDPPPWMCAAPVV